VRDRRAELWYPRRMTSIPRYLRFARAIALVSSTSAAAWGCTGGQPCQLTGQPCSTVATTRPPEAGCCVCLATSVDTAAPAPDGGASTNGVWGGGGCGGPLPPPSLDVVA